jgi:TRAP-type C4-dicarboxylate transport system permease small subunit
MLPPSGPLRLLDGLVETVATAAFIVMFAAALLQVLVRYVLHVPVPWTEELARVLFTLAMLLGIALAIRTGEHIRVEALAQRLPRRGRLVLELAFQLLILILLLVLARGTLRMLDVTWNTHLIALSWLRTGHLYLAQLIAVGLMLLYLLARIAEGVRALWAAGAGAARR